MRGHCVYSLSIHHFEVAQLSICNECIAHCGTLKQTELGIMIFEDNQSSLTRLQFFRLRNTQFFYHLMKRFGGNSSEPGIHLPANISLSSLLLELLLKYFYDTSQQSK